jgi:hypothetical protein
VFTNGDTLPILACERPPFCLIHQHEKSHLCSTQRHQPNGLLFVPRNLIQGAFSPLLGPLLPSTHIYKIPRSRTQAKYVLPRFLPDRSHPLRCRFACLLERSCSGRDFTSWNRAEVIGTLIAVVVQLVTFLLKREFIAGQSRNHSFTPPIQALVLASLHLVDCHRYSNLAIIGYDSKFHLATGC